VGTESEAERVLATLQREMENDPRMADAIWQANAKTNLAGQLFIRDIEHPAARKHALADTPPPTFLNLDFREAIDFFAARNITTPEALEALLDSERFRSFSVAKAISEAVVRKAFERIQAALRGEGSLANFIEELSGGVDAGGYPGGVKAYLENVFRTNTSTSYNAGRFQQQVELAGDDDLVWVYSTAGDNRVRASHAALDGKAWPVGDAEARTVYPPNSFNCRCIIYIAERGDVDPGALSRAVDSTDAITDGFRGAPGDAIADEAARA